MAISEKELSFVCSYVIECGQEEGWNYVIFDFYTAIESFIQRTGAEAGPYDLVLPAEGAGNECVRTG